MALKRSEKPPLDPKAKVAIVAVSLAVLLTIGELIVARPFRNGALLREYGIARMRGRRRDPEARVGQVLDRVAQDLKLTQAQKDQLKPVQDSTAARIRTTLESKTLTNAQKLQQMEQIREDAAAQINKVLTPQQQARFAPMLARMRERERRLKGSAGNGSGTPGPPLPARTP